MMRKGNCEDRSGGRCRRIKQKTRILEKIVQNEKKIKGGGIDEELGRVEED